MKHFHAGLRQLYKPVQPAVSQLAERVNYQELFPDLRLQKFIYCYWFLDNTQTPFASFDYRVVADGCIDVFFNLDDPKDSCVMGFSNRFTTFHIEGKFRYAGIRFLPSMFPQFFKLKASEISNSCEELQLVLPLVANFIERSFYPAQNRVAIQQELNCYFLKLSEDASFNTDPRLYNAIDIILEKGGIIHLEKEIDTGISPRQLRRMFDYYIGGSPKAFSKIVRFQNFLQSGNSVVHASHEKAFYQSGYYDQAHFIKDFKDMYGVKPSLVFNK